MEARIRLLSLFFLIIFTLAAARLFFWQILKGKNLATVARQQYQSEKTIAASRGNILAKDGTWLAARGEAWLIYATIPDLAEPARKVANKLVPFFVEEVENQGELLNEAERITLLLSRQDVVWVPLKHRVSPDIKKNIEALSISGIGFEREEVRVYPEASAAAHLLGFVGKSKEGKDVGYFGLEGFYNLSLSGKPGFLTREKDASGKPIGIGETSEVLAIAGVDLLTHIDKTIQLILEEELKKGLEKYGAKGATAIIMNPKNGAILAMSSSPFYDPALYWEYSDEFFKNPSVSDSFEPGSIFKILVVAAALEEGAVKPETKCEICSGPLKVDKYYIRTWDNKYYPELTVADIIVKSDNVGMAFVGQKLGADALYDFLSAFGIGQVTGIDLQGEASPKLREKGSWNIVDLSTTSFGQGIAVTPIQMLTATSAIANDGVLVKPQIVDKILGYGFEEDLKPEIGLRVVSAKTADEVTAMMVAAAKEGEAKWTHVRGFKVAGKTGTAQIPIDGHYDEDKTIASFVGFAPYDEPEFVMLVTLREPTSSPWASETAAPLWYSIARQLFVYFGIQPEK